MTSKKENLTDLILNVLIVLSTVYAVANYFFGPPDVLGCVGPQCFRYFTTDSNIFAAIASGIMLFFNIKRLKDPDKALPAWVFPLKFASAAAVTLTFLTVIFFLLPIACVQSGPMQILFFYSGSCFPMHLTTPILSALSLLLFERRERISAKASFWALAPTVVYSLVYLTAVVILRQWEDFYSFTFGGRLYLAPISMAAMYSVTLLIAYLLRRLKKNNAIQ